MKTCPRCGEKNPDSLPSCAVCGRDLFSWSGVNLGTEPERHRPDRSEYQMLLLASSVWGLPALLVPLGWISLGFVKVNFADPVDLGLIAGWILVTFCAATLVAALLLRSLVQERSRPLTFSVWVLTGLLAAAAGVITALVYSLQPVDPWLGKDPSTVEETIFATFALGIGLLGLIIVPVCAALTLPIASQVWPGAAERR